MVMEYSRIICFLLIFGVCSCDGFGVEEAKRVLNQNWCASMNSTVPSTSLYPEQWGWDSAFIAVGRSRYDLARAKLELLSLFSGQWKNGFIGHIRFNPERYFPGPEVWQSWDSPFSCSQNTSGIIDPPMHAIAVNEVFLRNTKDVDFLQEAYVYLKKWHLFLHNERTTIENLIYIRHSWASGMDNAVTFDSPLKQMGNIVVPPFNRTDCTNPRGCPDRPSQWYYDHFVWLVVQARSLRYNERFVLFVFVTR